jgi:hypothetical protein
MDDPARVAILEELSSAARAAYGDERVAERFVQNMLESAATAMWRVSLEQLEPRGPEPLPTHD